MRHILLTFFLMATVTLGFAQLPEEAIRYSWHVAPGTARIKAIGGASTAIGGDITSLNMNPAGLGFYKTSEFVFSPGMTINNTKSNYLGSGATDNRSNFNMPIGVVIGMPNKNISSKWKATTIGISYANVANLNNNVSVNAINNINSYSDKYLDQLYRDGVGFEDALKYAPYGASLGVQTYLIDPVFDNVDTNMLVGYHSNALNPSSVRQEQYITNKGNISDFSIGIGTNYNDVFHLGGSVNFNTLRSTRTMMFRETDNTGDTGNEFNYFEVEDYTRTDGTGFTFKVGAIFKPIEAFRIGLSYHSSTWYTIKDTYTSSMETDTEGYQGVNSYNSTEFSQNGGFPGEFTYRYRTPSKAALGLAYFFGSSQDVKTQKGFISADLEYVDYSTNNFRTQNRATAADNQYFNDLNTSVKNEFKGAVNARVGGELKFETLMVRAGVGYYGNPYKAAYFHDKTESIVDASRMTMSGGLGYRHKGMFIDLTYTHQMVKDGYFPYTIDPSTDPNVASRPYESVKVNSNIGYIVTTIGFKF